MRKARAQNHALVFDQRNKTVRVVILSVDLTEDIHSPLNFEAGITLLTQEQLYLIAQLDADSSKKDEVPLTQKQMERLKEQSAEMEAELEENIKPWHDLKKVD